MDSNSTSQPHRELRRDPDKGMLAGVAAGLGDYFGVDPTAVRLALVILAFAGGIAIPLYLLAWLVVPAVGTTQSIAQEVFHQWV